MIVGIYPELGRRVMYSHVPLGYRCFSRDVASLRRERADQRPVPEPKNPTSTYCFEKDMKLSHLGTSTQATPIFLWSLR